MDLKSESKESDLISLSTYSENEDEKEHEHNRNNEELRATTPGPTNFSIAIKLESWEKIKHGSNQLQRPWTDVLYKEFTEISSCCVLCFKDQHAECKNSQERTLPFFRARATCTFKGRAAVYTFTIKNPTKSQKNYCICSL